MTTNSVTFDPAVGGDGTTVTADAHPSTGLANNGHATRFVPALAQIVAIASWVKCRALDVIGYMTAASSSAAAAQASAAASQSSAEQAAAAASSVLSNPATSGTSNTNLVIGAGTWTLTTQVGRSFYPGMTLKVFYDPGHFMVGTCTAYVAATGSITVVVAAADCTGTGAYAAWTIGVYVPNPANDALIWAILFD